MPIILAESNSGEGTLIVDSVPLRFGEPFIVMGEDFRPNTEYEIKIRDRRIDRTLLLGSVSSNDTGNFTLRNCIIPLGTSHTKFWGYTGESEIIVISSDGSDKINAVFPFKRPELYIEPNYVRFYPPFNVNGKFFSSNTPFNITFGTLEGNLKIGSVVTDEYGNFSNISIVISTNKTLYFDNNGQVPISIVESNNTNRKIRFNFDFKKPTLIVNPETIFIGIPFNISGSLYFPGNEYEFKVSTYEGSDPSLGVVNADENGNITLSNCILPFRSDYNYVWKDRIRIYSKGLFTYKFKYQEPKITVKPKAIRLMIPFNVSGEYFTPKSNYDISLKIQNEDDYLFGSVLTNENGNFALNNCIIPSSYEHIMSYNKIEMKITETLSIPMRSIIKEVSIQHPEFYVEPSPVKLGNSFNITGQYFNPNTEYKISVKRKKGVDNLKLGIVLTTEEGNFSLKGCIILTGYELYFPKEEGKFLYNKLVFIITELPESTGREYTKYVGYERPHIYVINTPLRLGIPFSVIGSNFPPGVVYNITVKRSQMEDLVLGSVSANKSGSINLHNCTIFSNYQLYFEPYLDKIQLRIREKDNDTPDLYEKWVDFQKPKMSLCSDKIILGVPFNLTGIFCTPSANYNVSVKRKNGIDDIFLGSATADENGTFILINCIILSGYKLVYSDIYETIKISIKEASFSPAGGFTKNAKFQRPRMFVNPDLLYLGVPFSVAGQYFPPNVIFNISEAYQYVIGKSRDIRHLGFVKSDESGSFNLSGCIIPTKYKLHEYLGRYDFQIHVVEVSDTPDSYYKWVQCKATRIFVSPTPISLYKPFNVSGKFFAPYTEYNISIKRKQEVDDLFLGSTQANESGGIFLKNCIIPSGYKLHIKDKKVTIIITETHIIPKGTYIQTVKYALTHNLCVYLMTQGQYLDGHKLNASIYVINNGEYNEKNISGSLYLNSTKLVTFVIHELPSWWIYNYNHTFSIETGEYELVLHVHAVPGETEIWDNIALEFLTIEPVPILNLEPYISESNFTLTLLGELHWSNGTKMPNEVIQIRYSDDEGNTWHHIENATTNFDGRIETQWNISSSGVYLFKANWYGWIYDEFVEDVISISVVQTMNQHILIDSNSTIKNLIYDNKDKELSFTIQGKKGDRGYINIMINNKLIKNINKLEIYMDGKKKTYNSLNMGDYWYITIEYTHSSHHVVIILEAKNPPPSPSPPSSPPLIIPPEEDVIVDEVYQKKERVGIDSVVEIGFHASWESGGDVEACIIKVNDTECVTNSTGWAVYYAFSENVTGSSFQISDVGGSKIGKFSVNVSYPFVIWDAVDLNISSSQKRFDLRGEAHINYTGVYRYDGTVFNSSIEYNDILSQNTVGKFCYTVKSINDTLYDINFFTANNISIIFDRVNISVSIEDSRIDVGQEARLSWHGVYEYDGEEFDGEVKFHQPLMWAKAASTTILIDEIIDYKYGLKSYAYNLLDCTWDNINIVLSGLNSTKVNTGDSVLVWFKATYAYDGVVFDNQTGVLYCNDVELDWSPVNMRWQQVFTSDIEDTKTFQITKVEDNQYGLSTFYPNESVEVTWVKPPKESLIEVEETHIDFKSYLLVGVIVVIIAGISVIHIQKRK